MALNACMHALLRHSFEILFALTPHAHACGDNVASLTKIMNIINDELKKHTSHVTTIFMSRGYMLESIWLMNNKYSK